MIRLPLPPWIVLGIAAASASLLPAQHHAGPAAGPVPEALKLKGDPAGELDLGALRQISVPRRGAPKDPVTHAGYRCLLCEADGNQARPAPDAAPPEQLGGGSLASVRLWLDALHGEKPVILFTSRWTLVCVLSESGASGLRPEEIARLRIWFPTLVQKPTRLGSHEAAHLWAERLLNLENAIAEVLDLDDAYRLKPPAKGYRPIAHSRSEIFVFGSQKDMDTFAAHLFDDRTRPLVGAVLDGGPTGGLLAAEADEPARRRFLHGATLQLLRRHWRMGQGLPDWIQVGLAHYFERRFLRPATVREDEAGTLPSNQDSPKDWEQSVRDLAASGKAAQLDRKSVV